MYRPRDAEHTVLHQVIALHLEAFLGAVAEAGDGAGLPLMPSSALWRSTCGETVLADNPGLCGVATCTYFFTM